MEGGQVNKVTNGRIKGSVASYHHLSVFSTIKCGQSAAPESMESPSETPGSPKANPGFARERGNKFFRPLQFSSSLLALEGREKNP